MSVHKKLSEARDLFHKTQLKKTGHNKFAGYYYFELGDFLIPALEVFKAVGLLSVISFGKDVATMRIIDIEKPDDQIVIESPMSSAALKGAHEIQNLGAVETYTRRYLWVAALEIVEHDAIDSSEPKESAPKRKPANFDQKAQIPSVTGIEQYWEPGRKEVVDSVAKAVLQHYEQGDFMGAYEEYMGITDGEEKTYLRSRFAPEIKRMLKEQHDVATA